ncbi:MAG TPA: YfhO family protein [Thermoanaerobaculia bacterium]|nr:YfhO family protein [Thermoanaerobaculia bacterium]
MSALLYLIVAGACAALVRLSGRAAAALVLLPLCFTGRALLTGRVYAPLDLAYTNEPLASVARQVGITHTVNPALSDVYAQFIPWNVALRDAVHRREWPLWNPYELCGDPLAGAAQSAPYHPVTLLALLLPLAGGLTFTAAMTYFLAALSMFLFLRALELGELPSLFGAAAWAFSTHVVSFILTAHGLSIAVAPLVFLGGRMIARAPSLRSAAVLTLALVLLTLAGHPETELHVVAMAAAYTLFEGRSKRTILCGLGAGLAALLLCAIHLGPLLEAIPQTREFLHRGSGTGASNSLAQVAHILRNNVFPLAETDPHEEITKHEWSGTSYAGAILFAPALAALLRVRRREVWFFAIIIVFCWLAGAEAPGVNDLLKHLPLFSISVNARLIAFAAMGICVLAAIGVEYVDVWLFLGTAVVLAIRPAPHELIPLLLAIALIKAFPDRRVLALLGLLLIQRTAEIGGAVPTLDRRAAVPPLPELRALAQTEEPFRIAGEGATLTPNLATLFGLEDVRGYQAMVFAPLAETFPLWSTPQAVWSNRVDDLGAPMLSLMNVRYFLTKDNRIVENPRALPRAFIPRVVHVGAREGSVAQLQACRDFASEGWVASNETPYSRVNGAGDVAVRRDGSRLKIHATMREPGWIIVSEPAWKGWRATRARVPLRLHAGDHAFLAMYLPAGDSDVVLRYLPSGFVYGALISALALLSSAITFFMSAHTSFFAAGLRSK